ncbi:MAG TPA: superoxide dismutase family protein, partial [Tepidisphaeraceae bacterium]|nr:superoxide dismutase family protein [Tepidisphaeraceae bacterium]
VTFTQIGDSVKVVADVLGLAPNSTHGFHIHDKGDLSAPDLSSAGGHFNPGHHIHGGPTTSAVHEGDMGNLTADSTGAAHYELTLTSITIGTGAANDIVGHSVIIHAKTDDLSTQPSGNSGARVAGGVIELQK